MARKKYIRELVLVGVYLLGILGIVASGGGGGGGNGDKADKLTLNMSPYSIVSSSDDGDFIDYPLYPLARTPDWPDGESILIRLFDPYGMGDFYSIQISNSYGGDAHPANPLADDGEPDNMPIEAFTLPFDTYIHRGLNPAFDEDWFIFTSSGECCLTVSAKPNMSGSAADPVVEIYDAAMNPGSKSYTEGFSAGVERGIFGVFDPTNNLTLVSVFISELVEPPSIVFSFIFDGPALPGNYPVEFAFPPLPSNDASGSVTGTVNVDRYDTNKISGNYDITIFDGPSSTTASGSFDITREQDDPGLLTGLKSGYRREVGSSEALDRFKVVSKYLRDNF